MININHFDIEGETTAASTIAAAETAAKEDKPEGFQPFAWATDVLGVKDPHNKAQLAVVANERGYKISRKKKAENIIKDMHEQYEAEVKEQQAVHELPPFIPGEQTFTVNNGGTPGISAPAFSIVPFTFHVIFGGEEYVISIDKVRSVA